MSIIGFPSGDGGDLASVCGRRLQSALRVLVVISSMAAVGLQVFYANALPTPEETSLSPGVVRPSHSTVSAALSGRFPDGLTRALRVRPFVLAHGMSRTPWVKPIVFPDSDSSYIDAFNRRGFSNSMLEFSRSHPVVPFLGNPAPGELYDPAVMPSSPENLLKWLEENAVGEKARNTTPTGRSKER
ncbi:MAG TPA: hypothetical protein VK970_21875 [Candidatus Methylacidiphilales bacterium]|nr:hypothetical protein [Candidatus Methylacidiphilales bacterium]